MGRTIASASVEHRSNPDQRIRCDALVDTDASHVVLPSAWRGRLGELEELATVELELANQQAIEGVICVTVQSPLSKVPAPVAGGRGVKKAGGLNGHLGRSSGGL